MDMQKQGNGNSGGLGYFQLQIEDTKDARPWDGVPSLVDIGDYEWEITDVEVGKSKSGNPMIIPEFTVVRALSGDEQAAAGRKMRAWYTAVKGAGMNRLLWFLKAAGADLDANNGFHPESLIGVRLLAEVLIEENEVEDPVTKRKDTKQFHKLANERPMPVAKGRTAARTATTR
jgi:hypothetical protein